MEAAPAPGWSAEEEARLLELLRWETAGEGLAQFIVRVSPHLPPPAHLKPILDLFERTRRETVRAIIAMPPRHAKTITSLHALAWRMNRDPGLRHAYATYGDDLSVDGSRVAQRLAIAGGVELAKNATALHDWRTEYGGGMAATSVGGPLTGKPITGIALVDDTLKNRAEAESRRRRDMVWDWFTEVVWTRLEDHASCIAMGTMWHPDDLLNRLLTRGAGDKGVPFEIIRLPALAEENDMLGRAVGEALWPHEKGRDRFPVAKLEEIRRLLGEYAFAALYQQRPRPRGSAVFAEPGRFLLSDFRLDGHRICVCADPAATARTTADHTAAFVLAMKGYGADTTGFLLDHIRGQWEIPEAVRRLRKLQVTWGDVAVVVEAVAGFKAVPQMLREIDRNLRVFEAPALGDKFTRAQAAAAAWNSGRLLVPTDAAWASGVITRVQAFTGNNDPEDDEIDAISHGWNAMYSAAAPRGRDQTRNANPFG